MHTRATRTLAAALAATTLLGLAAPGALADEPTDTTPDTGAATPDAGDTKKAYTAADLKGVTIDGIDGFDPTRADTTWEYANDATPPSDASVSGLPDGWDYAVAAGDDGTVTLTFTAPDDAAAPTVFTYTLVRAAAKEEADAWKTMRDRAQTILDDEATANAFSKEGVDKLAATLKTWESLGDGSHATANDLTQATAEVQNAIGALTAVNWTYAGHGFDTDGHWEGDDAAWDGKATELTVTGGTTLEPRTVTLTVATTPTIGDLLGVTINQGEATGTAGDTTLTIPVSHATGEEIRAGDGAAFTRGDDGVWEATLSDATLASDNTIPQEARTITLTDGTTADVAWTAPTLTIRADGMRVWTATGTATGTIGDGAAAQRWRVIRTASRVWDPSVTIGLERRTAAGDSTPITLDRGTITDATGADGLTLTAPTLDHDAAGDQYTPTITTGADVTAETKAGLGDDGTREWTVTLTVTGENGSTSTSTIVIRQAFTKAPKTTGNPKAALDSILVNGATIDGWDPDTLSYTITAGENDKVTVSPQAKDGQTVKASDGMQTAYTTRQSWTVTCDGQERTYTVTLVRDHDTPTADEAFTPAAPTDRGGTEDAPAPSETGLKSVGYLLDGSYITLRGDTLTIPEGGTLAYETYTGQVARVQSGRESGMTWRYEIGVLAPDHATYRATVLHVTYLTAATNKAELTGIRVDGTPVDGFTPDRLEYAARVNDPERYVASAEWDKTGGMGVVRHVDGATTTLTAVSADGLASREYRVDVTKRDLLAETGATVGIAALGALLLAALGGLATVWARRRRDADDAPTDTPAAGAEPAGGVDADL